MATEPVKVRFSHHYEAMLLQDQVCTVELRMYILPTKKDGFPKCLRTLREVPHIHKNLAFTGSEIESGKEGGYYIGEANFCADSWPEVKQMVKDAEEDILDFLADIASYNNSALATQPKDDTRTATI